MVSLKSVYLFANLLVFATAPALALQEEIVETTPKGAVDTQQDQTVTALKLMLARAQQVRTLSAEHLAFLDNNRSVPEIHMMEEAAQVMAYSLICDDKAMDPKTLNTIANETTLRIALLFERSAVGKKIADGSKSDTERLTLVADIASAALMFKIGRRRGLFDALMTDFGKSRFCAGLGADMRTRYNTLAAELPNNKQ